MKITLNFVWGFCWGMHAMRLAHNSDSDSIDDTLGPKDYALAIKLISAGPDHSKFMRCITVWAIIQAPRYWWQQYDTYKVGTVALSESTMHTILKRPLCVDDFALPIPQNYLDAINKAICNKDIDLVKAWLPEGFLQTRGVMLNYQVLRTIYCQRLHHRLQEWQCFRDWIKTLPYQEFITQEVQE